MIKSAYIKYFFDIRYFDQQNSDLRSGDLLMTQFLICFSI